MKEASKTREETCCFTGHRKIPEEEREQLARRLEATVEELIRAGVRYFVGWRRPGLRYLGCADNTEAAHAVFAGQADPGTTL